MQHPEMLPVPDINQPAIATPPVRVNHGLKPNMTANHLLQRPFLTIRHDLGIDRAVKFEDAEDNYFTTGSAPAFATHMTRPEEVAFINFDDARKGRGSFAFFRDTLADFNKEHGRTAPRQTSQFGLEVDACTSTSLGVEIRHEASMTGI
jgi:hypothetical protein